MTAELMAFNMAGFLSKAFDKFKSWIAWSWTYLWALWFALVVFVIYILRGPLKLSENITHGKLRRCTIVTSQVVPRKLSTLFSAIVTFQNRSGYLYEVFSAVAAKSEDSVFERTRFKYRISALIDASLLFPCAQHVNNDAEFWNEHKDACTA